MNILLKPFLRWVLFALVIVITGWTIGRILARGIPALIIITIFVFVLLLVLAIYFYFFSDKILLRWYHAKEVSDANSPLYEIVHRLATKTGIPAPRIFIVESAMPNAFATGRNAEHGCDERIDGVA